MQLALIEYARNVAGLRDAHSTELRPGTPDPLVALITEWVAEDGHVEQRSESSDLGGTMRLGGQECLLAEGSLAAQCYGATRIVERHRHRYEVNNNYLPKLEAAGLKITGRSHDDLVEVVEVADHPWFLACQFHPEFTSTPRDGHGLFRCYVGAALAQRERKGG
jgi:CTP synthase